LAVGDSPLLVLFIILVHTVLGNGVVRVEGIGAGVEGVSMVWLLGVMALIDADIRFSPQVLS